MSFTNPPVSFVQSYGQTVFMMAQQLQTRLKDKVLVETPIGERHYFELYNTNSGMTEVTERFGDIILTDTQFERRAVDLKDYDDAKMVDSFDKLKMLIDPLSPIVQAQAAQMGRQIDDIIIAALYADMRTGKTGSTTSALPAGQVVAINSWAYGSGSGNSNLTVSKILEAKAKFDAAEVPDGERYFLCDGINMTKLLATTEVTSGDFVSKYNLEKGQLDHFAGFDFVRTERLPLDGSGYRRCFAFHKTGMGLAIAKEPTVDISPRKDKRGNPMQAYICLSMAATRLENSKVVEVKALAT